MRNVNRPLAIFAVLSAWSGAAVAAQPSAGAVVDTSRSPNAILRPVAVSAVKLEDGFWRPRLEANRTQGLPALLKQLEEHGIVDNFRRLTGRKSCPRRGPFFSDSDLYKWIEGASLALQSNDDSELRKKMDAVIDDVVAAQGKDGYLNTWFVEERAGGRFKNLANEHELYCAGHLFQAAVANYRATGERKLLDCATRYADYLCETFGPGKKVQGHCGHPEIEMALIELGRTTGEKRYLELAKYYLDDYGYLKHDTVRDHAVRQMYACCGGVDLYAETGAASYLETTRKLWDDFTGSKMYITGGLGSRFGGEAFGERFELPNRMAYAETCAAIGNAMWNWRMLTVTADARYADVMERALYNGVLSGVSLDTTHWFYVNPLEWTAGDIAAKREGNRRVPWFDCTCCPSNMVRTLASVPGYMFSVAPKALYVHLYDNCHMETQIPDGPKVKVAVKTKYPWDGRIEVTVTPEVPATFDLMLHIPEGDNFSVQETAGTALADAGLANVARTPSGYCKLSYKWQAGEKVVLRLDMPVVPMVADDRVAEDRGRIALQRGPVVYCLEGNDNPNVAIDRVAVDPRAEFKADYQARLLGGVGVITFPALEQTESNLGLYHRAGMPISGNNVQLTAIPYYAWANREPAPMAVWLKSR
jgi:uncharacterized protein